MVEVLEHTLSQPELNQFGMKKGTVSGMINIK